MNAFYKILCFLLLLYCFASCKKDKIITDGSAKVSFSNDTLTFDTVFVNLGSTTQFFTIRNQNKQPINISKIKLAGGEGSNFRINVNGDAVSEATNIVIPAKDSIYVFVEVTVDPSKGKLPFVLFDSVQLETNGNKQQVILQAWGQNAHFINGEEIETQTWTDDLPYVILNSMVVKEGHTLTINQNVDVYMGPNSGIFVEGNVNILGGIDSADYVVFRGLRLDNDLDGTPYDNIPGQWLGIFLLRGSQGNTIENAELRNGSYGINLGSASIEEIPNISVANAPDLSLKNVVIKNMAFYALFGFLSTINAENVLLHSTGLSTLAVQVGGDYSFTHCTFYNRGNQYLEHKDPMVYLSNFFEDRDNNLLIRADLTKADFVNCIIEGSLEEELVFDPAEGVQGTAAFNKQFKNCILKTKLDISDPSFIDCKKNMDLKFLDRLKNNFRLTAESPAKDAGITTAVLFDLDNQLRDANPDIGVYEFIP